MSDEQAIVPVREGSRWRYARPTSDEVGAWFADVPLDDGMDPSKYVSGVVLIPALEKVKRQVPGRTEGTLGTVDVYELTHTPYVRVDTRIAYFRALAAKLELIAVIEAVPVPRITSGPLANEHMPNGYWWYSIGNKPYLCCTMLTALYRPDDYFGESEETNGGRPRKIKPVRFGISTKQVNPSDENALAKAETGATGRALGVAGILVVGTGIATAEDMQERGPQPIEGGAVELPEAGAAPESDEALNERCLALQTRLQRERPEAWAQFAAWWQERRTAEHWGTLSDAPAEVRRGVAERLNGLLNAQLPAEVVEQGSA